MSSEIRTSQETRGNLPFSYHCAHRIYAYYRTRPLTRTLTRRPFSIRQVPVCRQDVRYRRVPELLTRWPWIKNISAPAFDDPLVKKAVQLLSNGKFHDSSHDFLEHVKHLHKMALQRSFESQCGPYVTLMTDCGTIEKRKFWTVILYTSSRWYFYSLSRVEKDSTV
jgi:hypothetical protein